MNDWLSNRSDVERLICSALRSSINDHGPITVDSISSAAKRVYAQLKAYRRPFLNGNEGTDKGEENHDE